MRVTVPETDKFGLIRNVVAAFPIAVRLRDQPDRARIVKEIQLAEERVNAMLSYSVRKLQPLSSGRVPRVRIYLQPAYRDQFRLRDGFDRQLFSHPEEVRAGIFLIDVVDDAADKEIENEIAFSHFLRVSVEPGDEGWVKADQVSNAMVCTSSAKVACLLHDLALDIAMFHSYASLVASWGTSVERRREFSVRKVQYAQDRQLTTFYGPVRTWEITYFCFAAAFRSLCVSNDGFDYQGYSLLWNSFIVSNFLEESVKVVEAADVVEDGEKNVEHGEEKEDTEREVAAVQVPGALERRAPISEISRYHHYAGQLPERKIARAIAELDPETGPFFLVIPQRRPARKKEREAVSSFFGRQRWRRGYFRILPQREYLSVAETRAFKRWFEGGYLSIFKFSAP